MTGWRHRTDRRVAGLVIALATLAVGSGAVVGQTVDGALDGTERPRTVADPERAAEIDALTAEIGATLRCPVCRQQSVTESTSRIAREMQGVIRSMLVEGRTPAEIEAYFVQSYGPWILLKPRAEGVNLLVYFGPLAAFLFGALMLANRLRRRDGRGVEAQAPPEDAARGSDSGTGGGVSKKDRAWLESAIKGS